MTRAGTMARVSSEDQAGDDRRSLPAQLREMRAFCERQGWTVVAEYEGHESAWTADLDRRPVTQRAITDAEAGLFDVLVVHESSRFARNAILARQMRDRLTKAGVRLVDMTGPAHDASADGKLFSLIGDGMNEWWSDKISEHTRKVKREDFARGLHLGDPPFGYRRVGPKQPLEIVPEEATAIREGYRDYASGASYTEILRRWNAQGLRPRSKRGLTEFTIAAMQTIFENAFYCGYVGHKGERKIGAHTPIITEELWQQAQTRVRRMEPGTRERRMLSGIATCALCSGPLWLHRHGRTPYRIPYYQDSVSSRSRGCQNVGTMWRAEVVEAQMSSIFRSMHQEPQWLRKVEQNARRKPKLSAEGARERLQGEKRRLTNAYLAGALAATDVENDREWRQRCADIDAKLQRLPSAKPESIVFAGHRFAEFAEMWPLATVEEQREACRIVFQEVLLDTRNKVLKVRPWEDFAASFEARCEIVGGRMGPPGFEPSLSPTYSLADLGLVA